MDDIVRAAMAKWPDVPHCYDWLALDRRGRWLLGGETLHHAGLREFIERNYSHDDNGNWFFQNGPQRVYVKLAYTPLVARLDGKGDLLTHTGLPIDRISTAWLDDEGSLLLNTDYGPALLDDRDLPAVQQTIQTDDGQPLTGSAFEAFHARTQALILSWKEQRLPLTPILVADAPVRLGYVSHPAPTR